MPLLPLLLLNPLGMFWMMVCFCFHQRLRNADLLFDSELLSKKKKKKKGKVTEDMFLENEGISAVDWEV